MEKLPLHLLDSGYELIKLKWEEFGSTIIEQITEGLGEERFPLFVAEGSSKQKLAKITHSAYLSRGLYSFSNICGNLFIYGHSLAENDEHILNLIPQQAKIENLFISIFGNEQSEENRNIIARAKKLVFIREKLIAESPKIKPLNLYFYRAESAGVWR